MLIENLEIAIVQADLKWEDINGNIDHITRLLDALEGQPHMVILPEMFTTGFSMNASQLAEPECGSTLRWMLNMASSRGYAICGSYIVREGDSFFNRLHFVTPSGDIHRYDKRHLFTYANENKTYTAGESRLVFEYLGWRILPQICYDVRFPVWSRNRLDYDLLINIANFPGQRRDIWETLLKARAIENQCYVAASNRVGTDGLGIHYTGDSQLISPLGQVVSGLLPGAEGIVRGTFSKVELNKLRESFPVLRDADDFSLTENQ